jgi:membrane-associated phospholipid phosphatase
MKKIIYDHIPFFLCYFIFLGSALVLQIVYSKSELFLWINGHDHPAFDRFFSFYTNVGDGITFTFIILICLFVKYRYAIIGAVAFLLSSQVTQFFKRVIFSDEPRPKRFFEGTDSVHFIEGINNHMTMSFPSGHTTTAFAIATFLTLISKNKSLGIIYFTLALLAGYSRVYVAQHFFADVVTGSVIGVFMTLITYYFIENSSLGKKNWMDKSLIKR